jgi:hypothetical protein
MTNSKDNNKFYSPKSYIIGADYGSSNDYTVTIKIQYGLDNTIKIIDFENHNTKE